MILSPDDIFLTWIAYLSYWKQ